jgi:DNA-binding response OmpR family regulator
MGAVPFPEEGSIMSCCACEILLVEDEFLIALDVKVRLEEAGYRVLPPVASVEDAMAAMDETSVCAAILDMNIRGSTSLPVAERLEREGVPFIFLSGNDTSHLQERFSEHLVLNKPIDYGQLLTRVKEICGF